MQPAKFRRAFEGRKLADDEEQCSVTWGDQGFLEMGNVLAGQSFPSARDIERKAENMIDFIEPLRLSLQIDPEGCRWQGVRQELYDTVREFAFRMAYEEDTEVDIDLLNRIYMSSHAIVPVIFGPKKQLVEERSIKMTKDDNTRRRDRTETLLGRALSDSSAFSWLISTIRILIKREGTGVQYTAEVKVRERILSQLGPPGPKPSPSSEHATEYRPSRLQKPPTHHMLFALEFDKTSFCKTRGYHDIVDFLNDGITLTGNAMNAQALPCKDYMTQTWPTTGAWTFEVVRDALLKKKESDFEISKTEFIEQAISQVNSHDTKNRTVFLKAAHRGERILIFAASNAFELAEVGAQLTWLGSALQPIPLAMIRGTISPRIVCCPPVHHSSATPVLFECYINYEAAELTKSELVGKPGCCWLGMFWMFTIIDGFPINSRPLDSNPGLELPLNLAADLINAQTICSFKDRPLLKGFSTMLCPTTSKDGVIYWHLLSQKDPDCRISYADPRVDHISQLSGEELRNQSIEEARHVIGWCPVVENIAGSKEAHFETIDSSGLEAPPTGLSLEEANITAGQYIVGGVKFKIGHHERPFKIRPSQDFIENMRWISRKFVVFYDSDERRAWLVDGASALLHLVFFSLREDMQKGPRRICRFDFSLLEILPHTHGGRAAAMDILTNPANLSLAVHPKVEMQSKRGDVTENDMYCFKHRVYDVFDFLQQMIDHHEDVATRSGVGFKMSRTQWNWLEGFDFTDVATKSSPLHPKAITLKENGEGWVQMTRAAHAVTLFGTGFGDILRPKTSPTGPSPCKSCLWNLPVPEGLDLLAASVDDVQQLVPKKHRNDCTTWTLLNSKFFWDRPGESFVPCVCSSSSVNNRVQKFRTKSDDKDLTGRVTKNSPIEHGGAVLFGSRQPNVLQKRKQPSTAATDTQPSKRTHLIPTISSFGSESPGGSENSSGSSRGWGGRISPSIFSNYRGTGEGNSSSSSSTNATTSPPRLATNSSDGGPEDCTNSNQSGVDDGDILMTGAIAEAEQRDNTLQIPPDDSGSSSSCLYGEGSEEAEGGRDLGTLGRWVESAKKKGKRIARS